MAKLLRYLAWAVLFTALALALLRATVIRWWQVPLGDPYLEASIAPTLRGGDWLILWRGTTPTAGDLVVCPEPNAPTRPVIARILGMPGQMVAVTKDRVFVNGTPAANEGRCDSFHVRQPAAGRDVGQACTLENIADKTHSTGRLAVGMAAPAGAKLEVPEARIFLVSDNRQFPWDSREFGVAPRESCRERVVFRLLSKEGYFDVPNRLTLIR